ncbi:MAG: NADH-quinone oxidoreductase subunit J [Planctomycetes bacterium]|nr:NADH-quinone oxidoreductase subunit J [Planctomycetota bacterium]
MSAALFYLASLIALCGAAGVILAKSAMGSVISLLASFFALAVIYLLAGFQFMAAAQILVYAGAILVLFLFVIMLLNLGALGTKFELSFAPFQSARAKLACAIAVGLGLIGLIAAQRASLPESVAQASAEPIDSVHNLALALFGRYSLPFQAVSVLLLVTMVAVMVLAKRKRVGKGNEQ